MAQKRNGFTLVELSIVLVIFGLLIGGILVAQSMIGTAKIQSVVRQLSQYDVAIANFQTRYNQLPGDSNLLPNPGNNDGLLAASGFGYNEFQYAWVHLSQGVGLKNGQGTDYQWIGAYSNLTCPSFPIEDPSTQRCVIISNRGTKTYYYDYSGGKTFLNKDSLSLDLKLDDGLPVTGKVTTIGQPGPDTCTNSSNAYSLSYTGYGCVSSFEVGVTTSIGN